MDWRHALRKVCVSTTLRKAALLREGVSMDSRELQELPKDAHVRATAYDETPAGIARASRRTVQGTVKGWLSAKMLNAPAAGNASGKSFERIFVRPGIALRLWVISDVHTDKASNLDWLKRHLGTGDPSYLDVLLCAGDVSNRDAVVEETMALFSKRYDYVFFTPGNHDVWAASGDSLQRIGELFDVCDRHAVITQRAVRFCVDGGDVVVLPLLSWYDDAFDVEPEMVRLDHSAGGRSYPPNLNSRWVDYSLCKWGAISKQPGFRFGPECGTSPHVAEHFAKMNRPRLEAVEADVAASPATVTLSHFAPRLECLPERRFLIDPHLPKVCGSSTIETQLRRASSKVHIFGHTHLAIDTTVQGTRYVNWPLGSERERLLMARVVGGSGVLKLYQGSWAPAQWTFWSSWYGQNPRTPNEVRPAPWVRAAYRYFGIAVDEPAQEAVHPHWPLDGDETPDDTYRKQARTMLEWRSVPDGDDAR
ncbi:Metallo-dependent phosphatase-like protein [Pelagophyceae sp. CCMP2097]|nr:Metallo-dependent phosphatase-like protein [Pelagophyceae sp. CCMP2097]